MKPGLTNVMVDIETVSTVYSAGILTIGAVPFWCDSILAPFYEKCSFNSIASSDVFDISQNTMKWWDRQTTSARKEAFSGTQSIWEMLDNFYGYIKTLPGEVMVWGNSSDFDNVILANAFAEVGSDIPWKYTNNRCFRTLKNLFPESVVPIPVFEGYAHNALSDAKHQAKHAESIFKYIRRLEEVNIIHSIHSGEIK